MKKTEKLLMLIIAIVVGIAIVSLLILKGSKKEYNNINNQTNSRLEEKETSKTFKVNQISDAKILYNLQKVVNNELELIYEDNAYPENYPAKDIHLESLKSFDIENNLKRFYIESGYETNTRSLSIFFVKGYLIYDDIEKSSEEKIEEQEAKLTIVRHNKDNKYLIEKYASNYEYTFKHNENDISKTEVFDLTDDEIFMNLITDNLLIEYIDLDKEVLDVDYAYWYFEDYQNKKLFKDQNKEEYKNAKLQRYKGNINDGFILVDNNHKEIDIKPRQTPMNYEVEEK